MEKWLKMDLIALKTIFEEKYRMHNFLTPKALSACGPADFGLGTCFELTLDGLPIRRGVICSVRDGVARAWFCLKSGNEKELFSLSDDLSPADAARLEVRPILKYEQFLKRVPAPVRALGGGVVRRRALHQLGFAARGDDRMHPELSDNRAGVAVAAKRGPASPGCSPPPSPKASTMQKASKPTLTSEVADLTTAVMTLQASFDELRKAFRKVRKTLRSDGDAVAVRRPHSLTMTERRLPLEYDTHAWC